MPLKLRLCFDYHAFLPENAELCTYTGRVNFLSGDRGKGILAI